MTAISRNYQKLKTLSDFRTLDAPHPLASWEIGNPPECPHEAQQVLRMHTGMCISPAQKIHPAGARCR
jgi:hypothetical protein